MQRAVIYCRCSTEEESQKDALAKQVEEAKECVRQKGWLLVNEYVESRSGTTTKGRSEYQRLYDDLTLDKFDIIVIKSQDRLMRNVKDWYLFVDRLTTAGKRLYIYIEAKFYTTDDSLLTGIKAILAEDYSRELSKKINNAHRNRQQNNGNVILTHHVYGFRKLPDKSVVLEEEEAAVKRRMYELCAAGYGTRTISNILQNEGILNRNGNPFNATSILRIIHNPINKGTVVMNRRHYDFETKKTIRVPEEEQYVYKNKVPATVSEELWTLANERIAERVSQKNLAHSKERIGKNKGKSQLSGKLYCGICGNPYYRRVRRNYKDNEKVHFWTCKKYLDSGRREENGYIARLRKVNLDRVDGCDNVHLEEETLYSFLQRVAEEHYIADKEKIICKMVKLLKSVLKEENWQQEIEKEKRKKEQITKQSSLLVDKLLDGVLSDEMYQVKQQELEKKLEKQKEKIAELEQRNARGTILRDRIASIENELRESSVVEKATVAGMLEEVEKIFIYPNYMEIQFCLSKMLGVENTGISCENVDNVLRVDFGNTFCYLEKKREGREKIVEMMKENPRITAKMIAKELGISLSGANYRIKALKKEGRIRFNGSGGKGEWVVF